MEGQLWNQIDVDVFRNAMYISCCICYMNYDM